MVRIPSIHIQQQRGEIGIDHTRAQINITMNRPQVHITQEPAEIDIEQKAPELRISTSRPQAAQGRRAPVEQTAYKAQQARNQADAGTRRRVQEARYVGDVTKTGTNRIAQNAKSLTRELGTTEIHIDVLDMGPEVEWEPGYVNVSWKPYNVTLEVDGEIYPDIYVDPTHCLEIYLRNRPYLTITMAEDALPEPLGRQVNENI